MLLIHNYSFAEDGETLEVPTLPTQPKEAPPISNVLDNEEKPSLKEAPSPSNIQKTSRQNVDHHKAVIEEYKQFLSKVAPEVRDEIREYRKEVIKLNRQKISLYKRLSQEAQDFLNTERDFKKRLPFRERKKVQPEAPK